MMSEPVKKKKTRYQRYIQNRLSPLYAIHVARRSVEFNLKLAGTSFGIAKSFFTSFELPKRTPVGLITEPQARFRFALDYYGYPTEEAISKQMRSHALMATFFDLALLATSSWGTYTFLNGGSLMTGSSAFLFDIIFCYGWCFPVLAYLMQFTFHYTQIKHRRLYSFWTWLRAPLSLTFGKPMDVTLKQHEYEYFLERAHLIRPRTILRLPNYA